MIERRRWRRLGLKLHIDFSAVDNGEKGRGSGVSDNISAGGVYFFTRDWDALSRGQELTLDMTGLSSYNAKAAFRHVTGKGAVLRLDFPEEQKEPFWVGVAAEFSERPRFDVYNFSI